MFGQTYKNIDNILHKEACWGFNENLKTNYYPIFSKKFIDK